tara:strand:+ start:4269 stop:4823 length:555 start_codon:yes stop_codon:yes gene_type:complete
MDNPIKLTHKTTITSTLFTKFLKNLSKKTYRDFNTFGIVNNSTIHSIVTNEISRKDKIKFFTFVNNELISYSFLTKFEKKTKNHNCTLGIVIADKWQNMHLGKEICKHMIKRAWKKNYKKIWLTVFYDNSRALKMYTDLGFQIEGVFMNDEKIDGKFRHVVSMALFKTPSQISSKRKNILKKFI